jgi:hypothetical protein
MTEDMFSAAFLRLNSLVAAHAGLCYNNLQLILNKYSLRGLKLLSDFQPEIDKCLSEVVYEYFVKPVWEY